MKTKVHPGRNLKREVEVEIDKNNADMANVLDTLSQIAIGNIESESQICFNLSNPLEISTEIK